MLRITRPQPYTGWGAFTNKNKLGALGRCFGSTFGPGSTGWETLA